MAGQSDGKRAKKCRLSHAKERSSVVDCRLCMTWPVKENLPLAGRDLSA